MSKYNAKKVEHKGIIFDSKMECEYYQLLEQDKDIINIKFQPKYELQPKFRYKGKAIRSITYCADFEITYRDRIVTVEVKGFETPEYRMKIKMFKYQYPDRELLVVTKAPKKYGGGFIELDELKKLRREAKRNGSSPS